MKIKLRAGGWEKLSRCELERMSWGSYFPILLLHMRTKYANGDLKKRENSEFYLPSYRDSIKNSFVLKDEALRGGISRFKLDLLAERVEGRKTTGISFFIKVSARSRSVDLKDAAGTTKSADTEMSFTTGVICIPKSMFESSRFCSASTKL
mmetsp:Transcript_18210/g.28350  ORF Transcript_18210/g.28350 Transcript_18210/m.28350 type:complete len:151 (+) Transcript_18210:447-899(+)